ncbi:MAG TPA: hypothetical protein VN181_12745 [Thermoanaerobaculia bacterium]|nr:hypothetical protein [Thermoanaerobaculia bacterium]
MLHTVLLVESHPDLRLAISRALARAAIDYESVANCGEALLKLRDSEYKHILFDVDSPSPIEALCDALEAEPSLFAKVVVIAEDDVPVALSDAPLLQKPFDNQQLLRSLSPAPRLAVRPVG